LSIPYLIIWIFMGNYLIFNLFMSILLGSFEEDFNKLESDKDILSNIMPMSLKLKYLPPHEIEEEIEESIFI